MRKFITAFVCIVLILSLFLTACGTSASSTIPQSSLPDSSRTQPVASIAPTVPDDNPLLPIDPYADVPEDTHFFYWFDDKNNIIIEQYTGNSSIVKIPAEIDGLSVTEIGGDGTNGVFVGSDTIEVIIIPEGVTRINSYSLQNLPNLKTVILPSTLKYIRTGAFENCPNLTDIVLPDGFVSFGDNVFFMCYGLTRMELPDSVDYDFRSSFYHLSPGFELVFRGVTYTALPHEDVGVYYEGLTEAMIEAGIQNMREAPQNNK